MAHLIPLLQELVVILNIIGHPTLSSHGCRYPLVVLSLPASAPKWHYTSMLRESNLLVSRIDFSISLTALP